MVQSNSLQWAQPQEADWQSWTLWGSYSIWTHQQACLLSLNARILHERKTISKPKTWILSLPHLGWSMRIEHEGGACARQRTQPQEARLVRTISTYLDSLSLCSRGPQAREPASESCTHTYTHIVSLKEIFKYYFNSSNVKYAEINYCY